MNRKFHEVSVIRVAKDALILRVDNQTLRVAWADCSPLLAEATTVEREIIEIAPSGYGLHWPLLDEDLAIGPLLAYAQTIDTPAAIPA